LRIIGAKNQNLHLRISYFLNIFLSSLVVFLFYQKKCDDYGDGEFLPEFLPSFENKNMSSIITSKVRQKILLKEELLSATNSSRKVRLLCVILTSPYNYKKKAVHVEATWGKKCNDLVFLSDASDVEKPDNLDIIELLGVTGRDKLWDKIKLGMLAVTERYNGTFDYLLKADDDTYVIVDNLINLLSQMDPKEEFMIGHKQHDQGVSYLSGGSGYVISRSAFSRIVKDGFKEDGPNHCVLPHEDEIDEYGRWKYPSEDLQMGKCAQLLNIKLYNSEINGQTTFFPFNFERHLVKSLAVGWWLDRTEECLGIRKSQWRIPSSSPKCVSPYVTSLHYVKPHMMYVLQFFTEVFRNSRECPR